MSEAERIASAYRTRAAERLDSSYSLFRDDYLFLIQSRERAFIRLLKAEKLTFLPEKRIVDVGCGVGDMLRNLLRYGARPTNLSGVDLISEHIATASALLPPVDLRCTDGQTLPYGDATFDIVMQFTVFTSILDAQMKRRLALEMIRVLRAGGVVVWYDFRFNNPKNPDVRGVRAREIRTLFPDCDIRLHHTTLAPPVVKLLAPRAWMLCQILERIPLLCTHYMGVIRKPSGSTGRQTENNAGD
jgi:SAM-dependent methyltransferase